MTEAPATRACIGVSYRRGCRCDDHRASYLVERLESRRRKEESRLALGKRLISAAAPESLDERMAVAHERASVLDRVISGELTGPEAGKILGCTRSSISAMKTRYSSGGVQALLPRGGPRHGTTNMYMDHGCRCESCSASNASRIRDLREKRKGNGKKPVEHGLSGYSNYDCRCKVCDAAGKESNQRIVKKLQDATVDTAVNWGKEWTGPELEVLTRTDMTISEMAKALGRTYKGVAGMKRKMNDHPREQWLAGERGKLHG